MLPQARLKPPRWRKMGMDGLSLFDGPLTGLRKGLCAGLFDVLYNMVRPHIKDVKSGYGVTWQTVLRLHIALIPAARDLSA